jgi:hypothetical protein
MEVNQGTSDSASPSGQGTGKKPTQVELVVKQVHDQEAQSSIELFHTPDQVAYITFEVGGHRETHRLVSKPVRRYLQRQVFERTGAIPSSQAIQEALGVMEGEALFKGPERRVHVRLAEQSGSIYLDLGDPAWRQVEITASSWLVLDKPTVKFRRPRGLGPLPIPVRGGSLDDLRPFLNVSDDDWPLVESSLVAMFRPDRPYPVLNLLGPQGSGKSTDARVLRRLVDPNTVELRGQPRDPRDLAIAASNAHVLALDNLTSIPDWLSDAICRVATEGGFATRELYSDGEEALFNFIRPVIVTGIGELAVRGDLLDRSILVYLPTITEGDRQDEERFWADFEQARSQLLGAVLDAVSTALDRLPTVQLDKHPRMADFARWMAAASPAMATDQTKLLAIYERNRQQAHDIAVEASPVASAVIRFMEQRRRTWDGTATELLDELEGGDYVSEATMRRNVWPKAPNALSNTLRRLQPNLLSAGIAVEFERSGTRRAIKLDQVGDAASSSSSPSQMPVDQGKRGDDPRHRRSSSSSPASSRLGRVSDQRKRRLRDGRDGHDGPSPTHPGRGRLRTLPMVGPDGERLTHPDEEIWDEVEPMILVVKP